jgi:hypothetical protein
MLQQTHDTICIDYRYEIKLEQLIFKHKTLNENMNKEMVPKQRYFFFKHKVWRGGNKS